MIHEDYILRMIQLFAAAFETALTEAKLGEEEKAVGTLEDAIGRCMNMKSSTVLALAPASLVTVMKLSSLNDSVAIYIAFVLQRIADLIELDDKNLAAMRREQAAAVAKAFEFPLGTEPELLKEIRKKVEKQK